VNNLFNFSRLYKEKFQLGRIFILPIIFICVIFLQEIFLQNIISLSFSSYLYFTIFFIIHIYCTYKNKHVPYLFFDIQGLELFLFRGLPAFFLIFDQSNIDDVYFFVLFIIWYLFLHNIYKPNFFRIVRETSNSRFSKIDTRGKNIHKWDGKSKLYYTERIILLLSFLLPFQESLPIDIKKISIFIFSFNAFILLLLIPGLRNLVGNIFSRLKRALLIFCGMGFFIFILTVQLHNLYNLNYPQYFSDIPTTLKTLIMIITGGSFSDLPTHNSELYILFLGLFSFLGIILLSFFTAYLVDSEEFNKSENKKTLLGKIDGELVFLKSMMDIKTNTKTYTVFWKNKKFICDKTHVFYDPKWENITDKFDILDAFVLTHPTTKND